ncbi:MAG: DivIVA domain-containing protein [Clostridiales bacterium]|nr:DivIVA domain-containing protein [Clostridiales bacterium]
MMTPQEVASHSFAKATLGGYNLGQVDEFLDALTEDYTALYNENAILKNKLKVLSDKVEEYRATEETMRKTLLAAQQMAESMMDEAKRKRDEMIGDAEQGAQQRTEELQKAVAAEEYRLKKAQESTAAYVKKLAQAHEDEMLFLSSLGDLVPPELMTAPSDPADDIKAALDAQVRQEEEAAAVQQAEPRLVAVGPDDDVPPMPDDLPDPAADELELDPDATRRYTDLQFGKDYKIQ